MRPGEPSKTARRVAILRAAHQLYDAEPKILDDPIAVKIIGPESERKLRADPKHYDNLFDRALKSVLVARSRFCEDALAAAVARGVDQFVILGAGLDTVAYRSPLAARLKMFEVDYPATQAWKRERLAAAGIAVPDSLTFAPIDFNTESLADGLARAGVDFAKPTFFSWLGVIYYLERETVLDTLGFIAARFPAESEIVFDYSESPRKRGLSYRLVFFFLARRVARLGEPWKTFFDAPEMTAELKKLGFGEIEDVNADGMNSRYFIDRKDRLKAAGLVHLVRARTGADKPASAVAWSGRAASRGRE